jgi:hypothetical protein
MRATRLASAWTITVLCGAFALTGCSSGSGHHAAPADNRAQKSVTPAGSSSESWIVISNSITNTSAPIIFQGVFTAGGTGINGQLTNKIVLPGGTFILDHRKAAAKQHLDSRSCLETLVGSGPYTLRDGTGRYSGIQGHGNLTLNVKFVLPRTPSGCATKGKPLAYIEIDSGDGPVSLPR